jgi:cysteinyl-tRNA synthetase
VGSPQRSNVSRQSKRSTILEFDRVLGLKIEKSAQTEISHEVLEIVNDREQARKNKNYKKSDELRDKIKNLGYEIKDTDEGPHACKKI